MIRKSLLILVLFTTVAFAQGIRWERSVQAAIVKGKKLNKPVMLVVSKDGCRWCVRFDDTTLQDKRVVDFVNKNYIAVEAYLSRNEVPYRFVTGGTPSTWFIKDGEPMFQPLAGAYPADQFLEALKIALDEYKKLPKEKK